MQGSYPAPGCAWGGLGVIAAGREGENPPAVTPARMPGQQWREKTASGCGNAASSALVPRVQLCPGPPGPPQHPLVAKLISKTPGAAPGCARSLVSSRPFPGALGGFLDLGGHLEGVLWCLCIMQRLRPLLRLWGQQCHLSPSLVRT